MQYTAIDPTLRSVSQGDNVYPVNDGVIELPAEIAADLLASGQIEKPAPTETKAEAVKPVARSGKKSKSDEV